MPAIDAYPLLLAAVAACEDKKAEDIRILKLDPTESGLSDYFVICNGTNDRQNVAITDEVELRLKREFGVYPNSVEGRREGDWVLMDYVDFILHVFSPEKREFYGLERLRKTATVVSAGELDEEWKALTKAARGKVAAKKAVVKKAVVKKAAPKKTAAKKVVAAGEAGTAEKKVGVKKVAAKKSPAKKATAAKKATRGKKADAEGLALAAAEE